MSQILVRVISDYVCPYCYVAKEALQQAEKRYGFQLEIAYLPYEINPFGQPQIDAYHDAERNKRYQEVLAPLVEQLQLEMKLPPKVIPRPYSRLAFVGTEYAKEQGLGKVFSDLVMHAYYVEEQDIGQPDILIGLAGKAGLHQEAFAKALTSEHYLQKVVEQEQQVLRDYQPEHVPTILIGDHIRLNGGAYTPEELASYLKKAEAEEELERTETGCGSNGCSF